MEKAKSVLKKTLTKEEAEEMRRCLPHRYGQKFYVWSKAFFKSTNRQCFLVAANQIGKSSVQIRKVIEWAVNDTLWPKLWPKSQPKIFWYLYPNAQTATTEFEFKWMPDFLPRGALQTHAKYGWKAKYQAGKIYAIHFNSGVSVFFKTYSQNVQDLQSGTVHYIAFDEELPESLYSELNMRISAVDGYMSGVFTATLNQAFWKNVMEGEGEDEKLPDAFKQQVSKYDCLAFEDGSEGMYTEEKIKREISMCRSQTEVQRRIFGKFVTEEGRKYPAFEYDRHMIKPSQLPVPPHWSTYVGIDIGTGGVHNHPAAIIFISINPMNNLGVVIDGWRGDGVETTSEDILNKFLEMKVRHKLEPVQVFYDWHSKDFEIIASRAGIAITKANKSHDMGEDMINTLFKNEMCFIYETGELSKLGNELAILMKGKSKANARDDFSDAFRYAVTGMPWDWNSIRSDVEVKTIEEKTIESRPFSEEEYLQWVDCQRRGVAFDAFDTAERVEADASWEEFEAELSEWESNYDT